MNSARDPEAAVVARIEPGKGWPLAVKWALVQRLNAVPYLSPTEKLVASVLLARKNPETGQCNPSLECLKMDTARSKRVLTEAIRFLIAATVLKVTYRRGAAQYDFLRDWKPTPASEAVVRALRDRTKRNGDKGLADDDARYSAHLADDARDSAHLRPDDARDSAWLDARDSAHLKGENLKGRKKEARAGARASAKHSASKRPDPQQGLSNGSVPTAQPSILMPISGGKRDHPACAGAERLLGRATAATTKLRAR